MLQAACVLAGCDFLASLKGISFRTAAGFVGRRRSLAGALKALRLEKRFQLLASKVGRAGSWYCSCLRAPAVSAGTPTARPPCATTGVLCCGGEGAAGL